MLIAVLFTKSINGAASWFSFNGFNLQPGEFAKIFVILFTAFAISKIQERDKDDINKLKNLLIVISIVAVPVVLLILQPDYGTATAYLILLALMLYIAGIHKRYIIIATIIIAIAAPITYLYVLPDHAKSRIEIFLNPESDARGKGYNIIQSKLAIGAGKFTGMGILQGNQTQLGYLYPKTTDFIFAVIGEETGFVGAGIVIFVYTALVAKCLYVGKTAKDSQGAYIATGIAGVFLFHMIENIGMTMGILPITGVPLLFVSYGGSSMLMSFIMIGILLNISGKRQKTIFIR